MLWSFFLCSQNSSDVSRHGLRTSEGVLWCLTSGRFIVDPLGPAWWGVVPPWTRPAQHVLQMLDLDFGPLLCSSSRSWAVFAVCLLGDHCHWVVLWWAGVWMGGARHSYECQHPRFPSRTLHCDEMINVVYVTCQWLPDLYQVDSSTQTKRCQFSKSHPVFSIAEPNPN